MTKDRNGWRIQFGWENAERFQLFVKNASTLREQKKFDEAKEELRKAISLDSADTNLMDELRSIEQEASQFAEKKSYFTKLHLSGITVGRSALDEIGVFGEVKNTGEKTLKSVEITIYCLDGRIPDLGPLFSK